MGKVQLNELYIYYFVNVHQGKDGASELNIEDKKRLEDRLKTLRRDVDCRQIGLKKLRTLLERLKGSDISTGPSNNSKDTQQHQCLALLRVTLTMDPENPRFELTDSGEENTNAGVVVEHAEASTRLEKGDRILEMNGKNVLEDCAEEIRSDILSKLKPGDQVELVVSRELTLGHIFEAKRLREELSVVVDTLQW
ncbi:unnamed protein product [Notodromas monacha]|uniref:PDZ domain-containing protein n=1 Tax=Notodromas monacha TaxID=399045 RepID=A0A7R9C3I5_9CRUS|nr:unnamed protein product [Notodromas monacha]CAG0925129.1 unnamed protein product [Notodromas monacha]